MMTQEQKYVPGTTRLGFSGTLSVLWPYFRAKFTEQVKGIWFIVFYLLFFQAVVLKLPVVFATMISAGFAIVVLGLMFFIEGLRLGLMPFGETIGAILPRNCKMSVILLFSFLLGIGATFAEPAIAVLKAAGARVKPDQAPLLYSLLNDFSTQLVSVVGIGVGIAVGLGVLRFFYGWSLKVFIVPCVLILSGMTLFAHHNEALAPIIALAWDCGAVTTGPVTVPLVLALGIGVCRIVGNSDTSNAGFGIVTLASLFPIMAVLLLGMFHFGKGDYYGAPNYKGKLPQVVEAPAKTPEDSSPISLPEPAAEEAKSMGFSKAEFERFQETGELPDGRRLVVEGGTYVFKDGRIIQKGASVIIEKTDDMIEVHGKVENWDPQMHLLNQLKESLYGTGFGGKMVAVIFAFFLGYGATLAEPALNALGGTVEKITVGSFKKSLLMQSVAIGVGFGIAAGVLKIAYNLPLAWLLLPPYLALLILTLISSEDFVNFGWDSAGVTTGPITVPLVLAMGLGIGGKIPGVIDGFGVLALESVGPIITVLSVGLIVRRAARQQAQGESVEEEPVYA